MKTIVIDALSALQGGAQTYLRNLLARVPETWRGRYRIVVFTSASFAEQIDSGLPIEIIVPKLDPSKVVAREAWLRLAFPLRLKELRADVLFCPGGLLPGVVLPAVRTVVTYQNSLVFDDKQRLRYPRGYVRARLWLLKHLQSVSFRYADLVIFISEYGKETIERCVSRRIGRSLVARHGVGDEFFAETALRGSAGAEAGRYVLYVSPLDYYKEQLSVVKAWIILRRLRSTKEKLVLIGGENSVYGKMVRQLIADEQLWSDVRILGEVPQGELPRWYQGAVVNLFASSCENCPNVLLEALAAGRAVVCSNRAPMPEIAEEAVAYFDPTDAEQLAKQLARILDDEKLRDDMGHAAREQARKYSWDATASATWASLEELFKPRIRVANVIEEGRIGGPQRRIAAVAAKLEKSGIDTLVVLPNSESEKFVEALQVRGIRLLDVRMAPLTRNIFSLLTYIITFPLDVLRLTMVFRSGRVDLVHVSGGSWQYKGAIAGKLAGKPVVWHLNDTYAPALVRAVFHLVAPLVASAFIVAGERVKAYYLEGRYKQPSWRIPAPVDTDYFSGLRGATAYATGVRRQVVTVGNVNPIKGHDYLIEALRILEHVGIAIDLYVVGGMYQSQQEYIRKVMKVAGSLHTSRVHFVGLVDDVREYLGRADLYVCSSIAEASPMGLWEAMSAECPVVSTDVGDVAEYVKDGVSGFLVSVGDPGSLADRMRYVFEHQDEGAAWGKRARAIAIENFGIDLVAARHAVCYRAVLGQALQGQGGCH